MQTYDKRSGSTLVSKFLVRHVMFVQFLISHSFFFVFSIDDAKRINNYGKHIYD